ncbi:TPA: hypothetical protein ACGQ50_000835 [Enterobacter cloacae]
MSARLTRHFVVDGVKATLTAGIKDGRPLVVLGILTVPFSEIANVAIEYPMKSVQNANKFVVTADDDVIRRGLAKYQADIEDVARRVNEALLMPYNPHSFTTRGQKVKRPAKS